MSNDRAERLIEARKNLAAVNTALANGSAGVTAINIDGFSVSYDRKGLLEEREYWSKKVRRLSRSSSARTQGIDLSGAHE